MVDTKNILKRGVTNIIPGEKELEKVLSSKKKLNVYLGIDPTSTKIHLGHTVPLRKLQQFVDHGHNVTFVIGDFTALVGDTSDKTSERPILTEEEIEENFKTYKSQAEKFLDFSKVSLKHNSEWLNKLSSKEIVRLAQNFSVGDFVNRELIKKRLEGGKRVRFDELLYPLYQGYDSFHLDTDLQIGGADQTFNMQAGRNLIKKLKNRESFILVTGYLEGTDGRKMSKSWGNAIWVTDSPEEMFGKVMSLKDELIMNYFSLATKLPEAEIKEKEERLKKGENPIKIKTELAFAIVSEIYNRAKADSAQENFEKTFRKGSPDFKNEVANKKSLVLTASEGTGKSTSEIKRLIKQGGIKVNGKTIKDINFTLEGGEEIRIGKKIFVKVTP